MSTFGTTNLWGSESSKVFLGQIEASHRPHRLRGESGNTHLNGWQRLENDCQIVAVADPIGRSASSRRGSGVKVPANMRFAYLHDMLKAGVQLDAVDICTKQRVSMRSRDRAIEALNRRPARVM